MAPLWSMPPLVVRHWIICSWGNVPLVILDVNMPLVDGFTVLEKIREANSMEQLPVIMLTAMGTEDDIVKGYELGANDYILKPFSEAQLMARVRSFLK